MSLLAHLSDLHFGTEVRPIADALRDELNQFAPQLVVVSGDLTQRARQHQFRKAQEYLRGFRSPVLVVPGNHDIPLYDIFRRFAAPLRRYCRFISPTVNPFYHQDGFAVLGLNTARSLTWKNGRVSFEQMTLIRERLGAGSPSGFKIVVTHHPFIPPPGKAEGAVELVGRARHALRVIDECGVDLMLAGHLHRGYMGDVRTCYPGARRSIIVVHAGTATSRRVRSEPNAYNLIEFDNGAVVVAVRAWTGQRFAEILRVRYTREGGEWHPANSAAEPTRPP